VSNKIRRIQALFPNGVGAIFDSEGQSFIAMDTTKWGSAGRVFREDRLQKYLNIDALREPPPSGSMSGLPFMRFPRWMFCSNSECSRMHRFDTYDEEFGEHPRCPQCKGRLTPMRFVVACEDGHIDDVNWNFWGHLNGDKACKITDLAFETNPEAQDGTLASVRVRCRACNSWNNLLQLPNTALFKCRGRHPWQRNSEAVGCNATVRVLQRNANNLRYDFSTEVITIPPYSNFDYWGADTERVRAHTMFQTTVQAITNKTLFEMLAEQISDELSISEDIVIKTAEAEINRPKIKAKTDKTLVEEEYEALTGGDVTPKPRDEFIKRTVDVTAEISTLPAETPNKELLLKVASCVKKVVIVDRLKAVRALQGFSRITRNPDKRVPVDLGKHLNWAPAVSVFGEGIFLEFDNDSLTAWVKKNDKIRNRAAIVASRAQSGGFTGFFNEPGFVATSKFLFLHTLAHLLILRMQFFSGYSAASIRERIYCDFPGSKSAFPMSAILLFTAAGDLEGSMGGVARLGKPTSITRLLIEATSDSVFCSNDPVCGESTAQGLDGLNLAACHSCAMVPETSCGFRNQFLDRAHVVGAMKDPQIGFLSKLVGNVESES
jgi:hypothetical protein